MNETPSPAAGDKLRDLWIELQLAPRGSAPVPSSDTPFPSGGGFPSGAEPPSGDPGGSGVGGYGISLVAPDRFSRERVLRIMRDLCEQDARRRRESEEREKP